MKKLDIDKIDPQTPTEFALIQYVKELERENYNLNCDVNLKPEVTIDSFNEECTVDQTMFDKVWFKGLARGQVRAVPNGQEIRVQGRPDGSLEHFQVGLFIHEDEIRSTTYVAQKMHELSLDCMRHIAKIYGVEEHVR